jgi:site-specific DNA-methyltransferase (adenine-specific)
MWIYSSGFPKSQDIGRSIQRSLGVKEKTAHKHNVPRNGGAGDTKHYESDGQIVVTDPEAKAWAGWGTALKPAHEPIALARKPIKLSIAKNCQQCGVGALNIDATRVPWGEDDDPEAYIEWMKKYPASTGSKAVFNNAHSDAKGVEYVRDQDAEINTDRNVEGRMAGRFPSNVIGEIPLYQKYFYCPKVSRAERHIGYDNANSTKSMLETMSAYYIDKNGNPLAYEDRGDNPQIFIPGIGNIYTHGLKQEYLNWCKSNNQSIGNVGNNHPTLKPIELMKYLIRLITPPGGTVLDPFTGSGSTGCAAVELGHPFIGCELDPNYVEIAQRRIGAWYDATRSNTQFEALFE